MGQIPSPFNLIEDVTKVTSQNPTCFEYFLCINQDMVSVYSVIFTIVLGVTFYIYSIKDSAQRKVLFDTTEIQPIIIFAILSFSFSFLNLTPLLYSFTNFFILGWLFFKLHKSISRLKDFNKSSISAELNVKDHKIKAIKKRLADGLVVEKRNNYLNEEIDKLSNVKNFLSSQDLELYEKVYLSESDAYIKDINIEYLKELSTKYSNNEAGENQESSLTKKGVSGVSFYLPFSVSIGKKIKAGEPLFYIKGSNNLRELEGEDFKLDRLFKRINVKEYFSENYLDEELRSSFEKIFGFIKESNYKNIQLELLEVADYFDLVFGENEQDYSKQLVTTITDNFITPLIKASFEKGDLRVINEINSFIIEYVYKSINQKSLDKLDVFLDELKNISLWYHSRLEEGETKKMYIQSLSHSLHSLFEYSLRPKLEQTKGEEGYIFYEEAVKKILLLINSFLILSYKKKDINTFSRGVNIIGSVLEKKYYTDDNISDLRLYKNAIIFGIASCIFRDYRSSQGNSTIKNETTNYLKVLEVKISKKLDNLLQVADTALGIADYSKLNWDNLSWDDNDDILGVRSGMISTHTDIQYFLTRLLAKGFNDGNLEDIETSFFSERLIPQLDENQQKWIVNDVVQEREKQDGIFIKISEVYQKIRENYDAQVKKNVISQKLNSSKIKNYSESIFKGYTERALIRNISKRLEIPNNGNAKGYNLFFFKERFIDETILTFIESDDKTFGKNIARSENNQILTELFTVKNDNIDDNKKFTSESTIVSTILNHSNQYSYAVIWSKEYILLEDYRNNNTDFRPNWSLSPEEKEKAKGNLLGKVGDLEVYFTEVFPEVVDNYSPSLFFFNQDDISINEFVPTSEQNKDGVYEFIDDKQKLLFSISDPSEMNSETIQKILEHNKDMNVNDLRSKVILKLYKGSELNRENTKFENILHYFIK